MIVRKGKNKNSRKTKKPSDPVWLNDIKASWKKENDQLKKKGVNDNTPKTPKKTVPTLTPKNVSQKKKKKGLFDFMGLRIGSQIEEDFLKGLIKTDKNKETKEATQKGGDGMVPLSEKDLRNNSQKNENGINPSASTEEFPEEKNEMRSHIVTYMKKQLEESEKERIRLSDIEESNETKYFPKTLSKATTMLSNDQFREPQQNTGHGSNDSESVKKMHKRDHSKMEKPRQHVAYDLNLKNDQNYNNNAVDDDLRKEVMRKKRKTQIFSRIKKKKKRDLKADLRDYKLSIERYIKTCDEFIDEVKNEIKIKKKELCKQVEQYESSKNFRLRDVYRKHLITQIIRSKKRIEMEEYSKTLLKDRLDFCNRALTANNVPGYVIDLFFIDPTTLIIDNPKIKTMYNLLKSLDLEINKLQRKFIFQKRIKKHKGKKELGFVFREKILPNTKDFYEGDLVEMFQEMDQFSDIVGDSKTALGKSILCFLQEIKQHGMENIPPKEYIAYVSSVVKCIMESFDLEESRILNQLTTKFIFDLIGIELLNIERKKNEEEDKEFSEGLRLLQHLSAQQVGVAKKFLHPTKVPFKKAIESLKFMEFCTSPDDQLQCVKIMSEAIGTEAKETCLLNNKSWEFGADDFFPILVYVIVKSCPIAIHGSLSYVTRFSSLFSKEKNYSEITYSKTVFQGAVSYVSEMTIDKLRDLLQYKAEDLKITDFMPFGRSELDYMKMENSLVDALKICEDMLKKCNLKPKAAKSTQIRLTNWKNRKSLKENKKKQKPLSIDTKQNNLVKEKKIDSPKLESENNTSASLNLGVEKFPYDTENNKSVEAIQKKELLNTKTESIQKEEEEKKEEIENILEENEFPKEEEGEKKNEETKTKKKEVSSSKIELSSIVDNDDDDDMGDMYFKEILNSQLKLNTDQINLINDIVEK